MIQCTMAFHSDINFLVAHIDGDPLLLFAAGVDWEGFRERLERIWHGDRSDDPAGCNACDAVLIFKLLALESLHNASVAKIQKNALADNIWQRFLERHEIELPPDKNTIWADSKVLARSGETEALFHDFLAPMAAAGDTPEAGQLIDSSWVWVSKQHNTRAENGAFAERTAAAGLGDATAQVAAEGSGHDVESEAQARPVGVRLQEWTGSTS